MFKKLLAAIQGGLAAAGAVAAVPSYQPYPEAAPANEFYALLFCDDLAAFQPRAGTPPADWQTLLFSPAPDPAKITALAQAAGTESRVRALAFRWLQGHGQEVPKGLVLGLVIEVPVGKGLDVLAAYADGSVRYINQSGKLAIIEAGALADANAEAKQLIGLAQPLVARIGPWDKARLPPPSTPNLRLTFVVSDGLYFGQGPFQAMQQDAMAGPLIQKGTQLLQRVVARALSE